MAHKNMVLTEGGAQRYKTRMLSAGHPVTLSGPEARLYQAMGWAEEKRKRARRPQLDHDDNGFEGGAQRQTGDDIAALRAEYQEKFGRRPFNGWSADVLRERIAAA